MIYKPNYQKPTVMKYEEAMKRLEEIVSRIEENKMDIDQIGESLKEAREP